MATESKVVAEFVAANKEFAEGFKHGDLPLPPARKVLVLTCMDARILPAHVLGLSFGDAHVVRNAGARASPDALRSIAISQRLLGTTEVVVIGHTDCGMVTFTNSVLRSKIRADLGDAAGDAADASDFLPFADAEASVAGDVRAIRASPLVAPDTTVSGFVYDVRSGKLAPVDA